MPDANKFNLNGPVPVDDYEDEETLAAIDEGILDAEAGRVVPSEDVRELLPQWITASSIREER
jgi:predicted transcriptional regulator